MEQPSSHARQHYHYHGYFEYVIDLATGKTLGTRNVPEDKNRRCGFHGQREETVTTPLTLQRGHKTVTIPASEKKPLKIRTDYNPICGRLLRPIHSA